MANSLPALHPPGADVHLLRFMLSRSASSHNSRFLNLLAYVFKRLNCPFPLIFLSHHALMIHGNYYELCRNEGRDMAPFGGMARFEMITKDSERFRQIQNRSKWLGEDLLIGTTTLSVEEIELKCTSRDFRHCAADCR